MTNEIRRYQSAAITTAGALVVRAPSVVPIQDPERDFAPTDSGWLLSPNRALVALENRELFCRVRIRDQYAVANGDAQTIPIQPCVHEAGHSTIASSNLRGIVLVPLHAWLRVRRRWWWWWSEA